MDRRLPMFPRLLALCLLALLAGGMVVVPAAVAQPDERLASARADLDALELRLTRARDDEAELEQHLAYVNGLIATGQGRYDDLTGELQQAQDSIGTTRAKLDVLQARFDAIVRSSFIDGGTSPWTVLFEEHDSAVAEQKMQVIDQLAVHQVAVAEETTQAKEALQAQSQVTEGLMSQQDTLLHDMRVNRQLLIAQNDDLQRAMDGIAQARTDLLEQVSRLKMMLTASDFERLQATFKGKDSISYGDWAQLFLAQERAPQCKENLIVMVAWQLQEGTDAQWNPLATTYDMPGATAFNYVGVRNYVSLAQGLKATKLTLDRGWSAYGYGDIVESMRRCDPAEDTASAISDSSWCCPGGSYVSGLIEQTRQNFQAYSKI